MLLECKQSQQALSKHELAELTGVNHNSIQSWRKMYVKGGVAKLLEFNKGGFKPSLIKAAAHRAIEKKINNPKNAFRSYEELRQWIDEKFVPGINYHTVNKYIKRNFGARFKVTRKSHLNKDKKVKRNLKKISVPRKKVTRKIISRKN